jgi:RNA polymerase sigma-70 factor (ECF subfamily)
MPAPTGWNATPEAGAALEQATQVRLAVTAMLQALPARQRGAFVLREVLGCTAVETAASLGTSVPAVNSALQRARAALSAAAPAATTGASIKAEHVERYARAIERADVDALASLVADDVVLEMPPVPAWSRGRLPYREFMAHLFAWRGTRWQTRLVGANGQPALLLYLLSPAGPVAHTLQLFDADIHGAIGHVLVYQDPRLVDLFETFETEHDPSRR